MKSRSLKLMRSHTSAEKNSLRNPVIDLNLIANANLKFKTMNKKVDINVVLFFALNYVLRFLD